MYIQMFLVIVNTQKSIFIVLQMLFSEKLVVSRQRN